MIEKQWVDRIARKFVSIHYQKTLGAEPTILNHYMFDGMMASITTNLNMYEKEDVVKLTKPLAERYVQDHTKKFGDLALLQASARFKMMDLQSQANKIQQKENLPDA